MCECLTNVYRPRVPSWDAQCEEYLIFRKNTRQTSLRFHAPDDDQLPSQWFIIVMLQERSWTRISSARVPRGRKSRDRRHRRRTSPAPDPLFLQPAASAGERGPRLPTPPKYPDQRAVSAKSAACSLVFLRMSLLRRKTGGNCQKHSFIIPISVSVTINCRLDLFA